jgi:4-amino-4-deoxy-L-arabinose transferase-like glycosyltransferase
LGTCGFARRAQDVRREIPNQVGDEMDTPRSAAAPTPARLWLLLIGLASTAILAAAPLPQVDADAMLYGRVAANVLATGDWLTFHYPGWFVDKPPVTFWLMALSFRLLGVSEVAMRLWQLLLALVLIALTYRVARVAGAGREAGLLAGLVLATSVQFLYQTTVPQQDLPNTLFLTLGLYGVLRYLACGSMRWVVVAALGAALAVLTSGIAGAGLFGVALLAGLLVVRPPLPHAGWPLVGRAALACAVFGAIAVPWFAVGIMRHGDQFVTTFLTSGTLGIGRFFTPAISIPPPYWLAIFAYVPMLLAGMLPWSPILAVALADLRRLFREGPMLMKFVVVWLLAIFVTLSMSSGDKVFRYLLPCFPPAATLTGWAAAALFDRPERLRLAGWMALLPAPGLAAAGFWFLWAQFPTERAPWVGVAGGFVAIVATALVAFGLCALRGRGRAAVALAAGGAVTAFVVFAGSMLANAARIAPWRDIAAAAAPLAAQTRDLLLYGRAGDGLHFARFYLDASVTPVATPSALRERWVLGPQVVVVPQEEYEKVARMLVPRPVVIFSSPAGMHLVVNWDPSRR